MWPPHSTISGSPISSRVRPIALKLMAQTPLDSSSTLIVLEHQIHTVWEAIALHTTPGVIQYMSPEVALLYSGVALDVLGRGLEQLPVDLREEIVAIYPRKNFKKEFPQIYFAGFAQSPPPLTAR